MVLICPPGVAAVEDIVRAPADGDSPDEGFAAGAYGSGVPKPYRLSPGRRAVNALVRPLARLGLVGPRTHLLTVPGRRSGKPWTTPVSLVELGGERYAVAPYGERNWVKNARAAGRIELRRGRKRQALRVEELDAAAAVPVLREYYRRGIVTRPFFGVTLDSTLEAWLAEAPRHPVFRLESEPVGSLS
jgi:deazaflavin-dependent oxidoreductase (nitroreductase family)